MIRDRVVLLLYAHPFGGRPVQDALMADVTSVMSAASQGLARLIKSAKAKL